MADIYIRIHADSTQAIKVLRDTDQAIEDIDESSKRAGKSTEGFKESLLKVEGAKEALRAIQQGFENIAKLASASVGSFSQQEDALKKLTVALQAQGTATPDVIAQYQDLAATFQKTTVFSDELINEMQALLTQVGSVMPEDMGRALQASTDLAAGLGIDLRTATMLVGKAFEGETGTLKRYGIVVDEADLKARGITAVLEALNAKFGGQAQAQLETYTGKTALMGNQMDELREKIGELIVRAVGPVLDLFLQLPGPVQTSVLIFGTLIATLGPIALGFSAMSAAIGPLLPLIGTALTGTVAALTGAFTALITFGTATLVPFFTVTLPAAFSAILPFLGPIGLIAAGVAAVLVVWKYWDQIVPIVKAVYDAVKMWLVDKFNAVVESIKAKVDAVTGFFKDMYVKVVGQSYVPDMVIGIGREFGKLDKTMVSPTQQATAKVGKLFENMTQKVVGLVGGSGSVLGKIMQGGLGALFGAGGPLQSLVQVGMAAISNLVLKGLKKIGGFFKKLFGGGEEGTVVNPLRDDFFEKMGGLEGVNEAVFAAGDTDFKTTQAIFGAKTKAQFDAAVEAFNKLTGKGITSGGVSPETDFGGFQHGTGGKFIDFGPGTMTTLHGKEKVVTEAEGRAESRGLLALRKELAGLRQDQARRDRRQPQLFAAALKDALVNI